MWMRSIWASSSGTQWQPASVIVKRSFGKRWKTPPQMSDLRPRCE